MATTDAPTTLAPDECVPSEHSFHRALRATYIGLDFLLTLLGNVLTIVVTRKVEEFSDSTKVIITSLAVADLGVAFVAATSLPVEILGKWIFPEWVCAASFITFYIFTTVSVMMVIVMTFDRLVAIVRPLRYALILPKHRSVIAVVIVWLACTGGGMYTTFTNNIVYNRCSAVCMTTGRNIVASIVSVLLFYVIPLALIMMMNVKILLIARQHARHIGRPAVTITSTDDAGQPTILRRPRSVKGKAVGVISLVTVAFAVSWSVYQAKLLHGSVSGSSDAFDEWLEFSAIWLGLTNRNIFSKWIHALFIYSFYLLHLLLYESSVIVVTL
ncbi:octopamine receptor beta-1R-like [Patiria miniata]|uniref:G-protein coupled receptors family 1 profile domain-containing protein n=1 Tax=Patiria miniata TaxID=46514 RepID=A0A913YZW1_PATMI|nr:octopamine receptor beta-1R-like [Patiria miniata]